MGEKKQGGCKKSGRALGSQPLLRNQAAFGEPGACFAGTDLWQILLFISVVFLCP